MAYTYLDVTNEVLNRFNEVELTSSGFGNARGFQIQCKNAVNDAINYIYQREFGWSFSHSLQTETLVASTTRYTISFDFLIKDQLLCDCKETQYCIRCIQNNPSNWFGHRFGRQGDFQNGNTIVYK